MSDIQEIRNKIDNYNQTIHAIVGFMNFFRYDDKKKRIRDDVVVFQGRRFEPSPEKSINQKGGKVEITFYFRQYDDVLTHFIELCLDEEKEDKQLKLFKEEEFP